MSGNERGCGWLPDERAVHEAHPVYKAARAGDLSPSAVLGSPPPDDQGVSSACVGFAIGGGVDTCLIARGVVSPRHSVLAPYAFGREGAPELVDEGCQPSVAVAGLTRWGIVLESAWPFTDAERLGATDSRVNTPPPLDVLEQASAFRLAPLTRVVENDGAPWEVAAAIDSSKRPVIFGALVGAAFFAAKGPGLIAPCLRVDARGGHMLLIVGYRFNSSGGLEFRVRNSYGLDWGDGGYCWVGADFIRAPGTGDIYPIEVA